MNIELLEKVKEQILREPKQFVIHGWFANELRKDATEIFGIPKNVKIPNCGTAACIKGWAACIVANNKPNQIPSLSLASCNLCLTKLQEQILFLFKYWPSQFKKIKSEGTIAFARQAARRIDHFIKTNGKE